MNISDQDRKINDYAIRAFRDTADLDYIAARMSFRAKLVYPALWQSQQSIEKYLKCVLLLNRIPAKGVNHSLKNALGLAQGSSELSIKLSPSSEQFFDQIDAVGQYRYFDVSTYAEHRYLMQLDRIVWELRRLCTFNKAVRELCLVQGQVAPKYELDEGKLEEIYLSNNKPARNALLWKNAFFGGRRRRRITMDGWVIATNTPLYSYPEILDELVKYISMPKSIETAWRQYEIAACRKQQDT